ncbi:MAG: DUF2252 family protein [Ekhidna sp.]|nr:DUF2252 family protein [Ekhidna sp.]
MSDSKKLFLNNRIEQIKHELRMNNEGILDEHRMEKFEKMSTSPYAFYRGSNHLYWEDFYNDWRVSTYGGVSSTLTWVNGDAHIYNYGAYANHDGEAIFCMDDFDDAIVADYQFDLWRMAVSIVLDCRENGVFTKSEIKEGLMAFAKAYREEMVNHRDDDSSNDIHLNKNNAPSILGKFLKKVEEKKSRKKMLNKWTVVKGGSRVFDFKNPKLVKPSDQEYQELTKKMMDYQSTVDESGKKHEEHFTIKDIAKRASSGTGSLGSDRYYVLIEGETEGQEDDVILDVKEQGKAPVYRHMNKAEKKEYDELFECDGQRHALAFKALAEHPDQYLGWFIKGEKSFSVKERSPFKADFPTEKLKTMKKFLLMTEIWGQVLAARHKRASYELNDELHEMPIAFSKLINGEEQEFDEMVRNLAIEYANQVKRDYTSFLEMI